MISTFFCFPESSAYPGQEWRRTEGPVFAQPPVLREGEDVANYFQGTTWTKGGFIHWVIFYSKSRYAVLRWNMHTGETQRVLETDARIRAMAYSFEEDALVLRKSNSLEYYDNKTLKFIRSQPFENLRNWWRDMAILNNRIITIEPESNALGVFDAKSGRKLQTLDYGKEKIQRLYGAGENRVWLWSSYWGTRFYLVDIETGKTIKEARCAAYHRVFFMAKEMGENTIGVFDIANNTFGVFQQEGKMWINTTGGFEMLGDSLAFRYEPMKEAITGKVSIESPSATLGPAEAVFAIPQNTYGQRFEHESFPFGGTLIYDALGNRYLRVALPEIKQGSTFSRIYYKADLTRWRVYFNMEKIGNVEAIDTPEPLSIYLKNEEKYSLEDKKVVGLYTSRFKPLSPLNNRVEAIYNFARDEIDDVWDERSDKVPVILGNMHGGCTEHSYVQIAMLRLSGLPARFNWNAFPDHEKQELDFNHKHAEVWFPESGWIPLEPLGMRMMAGMGANYHLIFTVHSSLGNEFFDTYDRIAAYTGSNRWRIWEAAPLIVSWERSTN